MSEQTRGAALPPQIDAPGAEPVPQNVPGGASAGSGGSAAARWAASGAGRNLGLVFALLLLCVIGAVTGGEQFLSRSNLITNLELAATIGVISIGMTFVITGGGIDLSVGAIVALASVWSTTLATQQLAADYSFLVMVVCALLVGAGVGAVNGILIAYGGIVPFIMTLAMLASARGLAELISDNRSQLVTDQGFRDVFRADLLGVPVLVLMFAAVAAAGWVVLNRTTFGRRTIAVGGNPEAARLAGIDVKRHTMWLYILLGTLCGLAAVMITARTTTGVSTHGNLYELEAIAAVVIGGTLLSGGRGTIVGTVLGVLIFTILTNIFVINNLTSSSQAIARGAVIVVAVLLQARLARSSRAT